MAHRPSSRFVHVVFLLFLLVGAVASSTGPAEAQGSATLNIRLRGCPEGVHPLEVGNPKAACTIPLDAPDDSGVFWGGDGQGGMPLADVQRIGSDGSYQLSVPANTDVRLFGFEPSVYDDFVFVDADSTSNGEAIVNLPETDYRQVSVYYFHDDSGTAPMESATLSIRLRSCGNQDPNTLANPAATCTKPIDAPDDAGVFWGGDGQGGMPLVDMTRLYNGTYSTSIPAGQDVEIFGLEPSVHDTFTVMGADDAGPGRFSVNVAAGDELTVLVFYYNH